MLSVSTRLQRCSETRMLRRWCGSLFLLPTCGVTRWLQPPGLDAQRVGCHTTFAPDESCPLARRVEGVSSMLTERRVAVEGGF